MPQRKCAQKRLRVDKKRRLRNIRFKVGLKSLLKKFQSLLSVKNIEESKKALRELISKLDRASGKGIISKNTASRKKSRLTIRLNKINAQ